MFDCSITHPSANWYVHRGTIPKNIMSLLMGREGKIVNRLKIDPAHPVNNGKYLCKFEKVVTLEVTGATI